MEKFKKTLTKLLFPPVAVIITLIPISVGLLIYAFTATNANTAVVYFSYVLSAYTLTVICAKSPAIFEKIKNFRHENKYLCLYFTDAHLRVKISLYASTAFNALYAMLQLFSGFRNNSVWFYALAGYYILLAVMRFFLLRDTLKTTPGRDKKREFIRYRFCGIMLLLMHTTLSVIVFYIVRQNKGFEYHYIHTIAMAAFTFTVTTMAIINVFKYRRFESPVFSAAKSISLASALVSMLSLETAMLTAFGSENDALFRRNITAATGAAVCTFVLGMAIYMIINSTKQLSKISKENNIHEKQ